MAVFGYLLLQNIHGQENWNLLNIEYPIPLLQMIFISENGYAVHIPLIVSVTCYPHSHHSKQNFLFPQSK